MTTANPNFLYRVLQWGSFLLLSVICLIISSKIDLGFLSNQLEPAALCVALIYPIHCWSQVIAMRIMRRMGVNPTSEVIKRGDSTPQDVTFAPLEFFLSEPLGLIARYTSIFTIVVLLLLTAVLFLPAKPGTRIYGFLLVGFFGLPVLFCWIGVLFVWLGYDHNPFLIARVDRRGIKGSGGFWYKTADWKDIDRCEVIVLSNFSRSLPTQFVFKDSEGKVLLNVGMDPGQQDDIASLKTVVESYLKQARDGDQV